MKLKRTMSTLEHLIVISLLLVICFSPLFIMKSCHADSIAVSGFAWHEVQHGGGTTGLNETNFGLGYEHPVSEHNTLTIGYYDNSFYHHSNYFFDAYQPLVWDTNIGTFKYGIIAGVVSGYYGTSYIPIALPVLSFESRQKWGINLITVIPPLVTNSVFALQFKYDLQ